MDLGRELFGKRPSIEALQAFGIPLAAVEPPAPVEPYPEHTEAFQCFIDLSGQWRMSHSGVFALDYNVVYRWMDSERVKPAEQNQLLREIGLIERGALEAINEAAEEERRKAKG
ncbi:DUF1799 domain-containing protein [Diaphorobacter caeni]|uniref:DUF1799 domain-containing protein n=1 Tax=Diaphorobacter caeni TaxID=2784387 RepID=UPI00188F1EEC|nr:DUF1799 domain-containing protein [Diaphorobacter caeni]MBF5006009.1 DUF1799 domain-containing protein [Diaphorobacter caeni]